jgi:beta-glucosidase-like glycosyl hydrolase
LAPIAAFVSVLAGLFSPEAVAVKQMTPREKAAIVVVSGLPAPAGVGGVIVRRWDRDAPRPEGTLVFVDQEGGGVRAYPSLPPSLGPRGVRSSEEAFAAGRETGRALRRAGVHVDLAPVLDDPDGPLGARHFMRPEYGVAFVRGLAAGRAGACAKHFPGLGSAAVSTDTKPHVPAVVRQSELRTFKAAVDAGVPCVMTGHAFYRRLGRFRASLEPETYRLLRSLGFGGVAITDSLDIVGEAPRYWPTRAMRAGADMLLFTSPISARRAIRQLLPMARRGELDDAARRVVRFRATYLAE